MKQLIILCVLFFACNKPVSDICPDCGEADCIYLDINRRVKDGSDTDINEALIQVAKERNLTPEQIELLAADYYL